MAPGSIFIIVYNHDKAVFSVHGPMPDASVVTARVYEACKAGRNITSSKAVSLDLATAEATRTQPMYEQCRFAI